jgi:DNA-binding NtrC family response regulator
MELGRILIVEDDPALSATLHGALGPRARQVCTARSLQEAARMLEPPPDVVLMDYALPDGTVEPLLQQMRQSRPAPLVIAMSGAVSTEVAFALAQKGVRAFLQKPFDLQQLCAVCERSLSEPPQFDDALRQAVGRVPLRTLEVQVRDIMIDEALAKSRGSRRAAAKLLDISRQLLQHVLRKDA